MAPHARTRLPIYHIIILRLATLSEIFNQIKIHTFKTSMKTKNIMTTTENKLKGAVSLRANPGETWKNKMADDNERLHRSLKFKFRNAKIWPSRNLKILGNQCHNDILLYG